MNFFNNIWSKVQKTKEIFEKAEQTKQQVEKAERLAQTKKLREAVKLGKEIEARWSTNPSWVKELVGEMAMGDLLYSLKNNVSSWELKIKQAENLLTQAKELENQDQGTPFETKNLSKCLELYKQHNKIIDATEWIAHVAQLESKIDLRNRFQNLVNQAKNKGKNGFYKEGIQDLFAAQKLFDIQEIQKEIIAYQQQGVKQEKYENSLNKTKDLARQGYFLQAITLFKSELVQFTRSDGKELLAKLEEVFAVRQNFQGGLIAEKKGDLALAILKYKSVLQVLPELEECQLRLGIATLKQGKYAEAISCLKDIKGEEAAYFRGFAYAKQEDWRQANREWKTVKNIAIKEQFLVLRNLVESDRSSLMQTIQQFVENNQLLLAQETSEKFMAKFGAFPVVESNLNKHILPLMEHQLWQTQDWEKIGNSAKYAWLAKQDITSLHNWAIATYYLAHIDASHLPDLIIIWFAALANININPKLKDLPWLGSTSLDLENVAQKLTKLIEDLIDGFKEKDVEKYLNLRDIYRQEKAAITLLVSKSNLTFKAKEILITPGLYLSQKEQFTQINLPNDELGALYTHWGKAVAACLQKDADRGIKIKPSVASSTLENFADSFVSYHESCYYLENSNWHQAREPLKKAKNLINSRENWSQNLDKLCTKQSKKIEKIEEHLEFAQFWYDSLNSKGSKTYLVEYKTRNIALKLSEEKITPQNGLSELNELKKIDSNNPILIEVINKVEFVIESEKIERYFKQNNFEEAIRLAKLSHNQDIRHWVAKICVDILLNGAENQSLSYELIRELGLEAYKLCPHAPEFQEIYRTLKIIY